jgi:REP element-mobilizing transposase RayT
MPRQARIEIAGAIYHLTARGDRRQVIFRDDIDRQNWLRTLGDVCARYGWRIHAFCQMGNHYHLVAETPQTNLSDGMRDLHSTYTQRFNLRHAMNGHVFQGRFHSEIVHRQTHLLETVRYVVLNPVRAGMVATPGGWPWSSYAMTCDRARAPQWLETDWVLEQFADNRVEAVRGFRRFVADGCIEKGDRHLAASVPPADTSNDVLRNYP